VKAYSDILSQNTPGETLEKIQQFSKNCCSILNQLRDLGVNIKFLLPQGECHHQTSFTTKTQLHLNTPVQQVIQPIQETSQDKLKHSFAHRLLKMQLSKDRVFITVTRL